MVPHPDSVHSTTSFSPPVRASFLDLLFVFNRVRVRCCSGYSALLVSVRRYRLRGVSARDRYSSLLLSPRGSASSLHLLRAFRRFCVIEISLF